MAPGPPGPPGPALNTFPSPTSHLPPSTYHLQCGFLSLISLFWRYFHHFINIITNLIYPRDFYVLFSLFWVFLCLYFRFFGVFLFLYFWGVSLFLYFHFFEVFFLLYFRFFMGFYSLYFFFQHCHVMCHV